LQIVVASWHGQSGTQAATSVQAFARIGRQIARMGIGLVVLIAENDRDMRGYVRRCVEKHDVVIAEVLEAQDGQEALDVARGRRIDLLITDGAMPRLDGFALCKAVRGEANDHRPRVLVVTGQFDRKDAERRARAAGADGLLLKPFNALSLCEKIDQVLGLRSPPINL
jgi:CheY-like chemotaxis protein